MCITRNELEKKIEELRSLKALKEETEKKLCMMCKCKLVKVVCR